MSDQDTKPEFFHVVLDFDGVIHSYVSGWTGVVPEDPPVPGVREAVYKLIDAGKKVAVCSVRARHPEGTQAIHDYLAKHGFPKELRVFKEKVSGGVYVDDRGLRFEGDAQLIADLADGHPQPWMKEKN